MAVSLELFVIAVATVPDTEEQVVRTAQETNAVEETESDIEESESAKEPKVSVESVEESESIEEESSEETESEVEKEPETQTIESKESEAPREYSSALSSAYDYLNYTLFSKKGLYEQLIYEKYPEDAVQYAIDNVEVDWNQNALQAAEDYLDYTSFSSPGLYDQLLFEG